MASIPLVSQYLRYKTGTNRLVNWLASSAQQLNDRQALSPGTTPDSTIPKTVTVSTLVEYAKRIVNARNPTIEISTAILDITKDAILGRTAAMKWYQELVDNGDSASVKDVSALRKANGTHKHFLLALEQVFEIPNREHKSRRPKRKKQMPKLASLENDLTNLYQHLHIEEPADDPDDQSTPKCNAEFVPPVATSDGFELDNELEDNRFAVWCLLKDMSDIRLHLKDVWRQYKQGSLSFLVAARIADSAMYVCWELAAQFEKVYPEIADFDKLIAIIGVKKFNSLAMHAQMHHAEEDQDETPPQHHGDLLCCHAWRALETFRNVQLYVWSTETEKRDMFGDKKPSIHLPGFPFSSVLMNLAFDLREAFPAIGPRGFDRTKFTQVFSNTDFFLAKLLEFSANKKMEIGLVAATQIYADMHDELRGNISFALQETERAHHFTMDTVRKYLDGPDRVSWLEACGSAPLSINQERNGLRGWVVRIPKGYRDDLAPCETFIPESILRALPLLPAIRVRCHLYAAQHQAIDQMSQHGMLLSAAHLYHAGRMTRAISAPWEDMDFLIERQEARGVSLRLGAATPRSVARHYFLAMGHSLAEVMKSKALPNMLSLAQAESKRVKCVSACLFDTVQGKTEYTSEIRLLYQVVQAYGKRIKDKEINAQYLATKRLNPVQLLQIAQEVLVDDEPHLYFDYLNFGELCRKWLVDACNLVAKAVEMNCVFSRGDKDLYIPTSIILWRAVVADDEHRSKFRTELCQVGKLADRLIASHGSKYKTQLLEIMSSRTSLDGAAGETTSSGPRSEVTPDEHFGSVEDIRGPLQHWHDRHYPAEAQILKDAHETFTLLTATQGAIPEEAVRTIENQLDTQYRKKTILKQPTPELVDGQLVITTKPLDEQGLETRVRNLLPPDCGETLETTRWMTGFTMI
ncbi:unnamed protein product [Cercospora beticola]|nr:unnamed protein product [Cercospora beticola]